MSNDRSITNNNRVVWKEGTFLRPQHFQQHDRYFESLVESRAGRLRPYAWGLSALGYDRNFLAQGKLALKGVPIRALAVAPRQLPYHQGFAYFELDKSSEIWGTLKKSGGIGFFAGSGFPALELELCAIRSE